MQAPIRSTLPREQALALVAALLDDPNTAKLLPRIDYVGDGTDNAWVSIRAPKDKRIMATNAALEVAKKVLDDNFSESVIGFIEMPLPPAARGR